MRICIIISAAGMSVRQKRNKLLIRHCNETIIEKTVDKFLNHNLKIIVVIGHQKELITPVLEDRFRNAIQIVFNPDYKSGIASSLKVGLKAAGNNYDYYGFHNGDKPFIDIKTIKFILKYLADKRPSILVPLYQEKSGHPTFFSNKFMGDLELIEGDTGGRDIIKKHAETVTYLPLNDRGTILDMDKFLQDD